MGGWGGLGDGGGGFIVIKGVGSSTDKQRTRFMGELRGGL